MIAPSSFPVFGAESIVNIKLLKALKASGDFIIDLVSKKSKWEFYPSDSEESLSLGVNSISIIEVDNKLSIKVIWQHIKSFFKFGAVFKGSHWAAVALPKVQSLVRVNNYDYVLTKNASAYLIGFYLKKKYGLKWIATWNDPYPTFKYPFPYGDGYDAKCTIGDKRELEIMSCADLHIFPNYRLRDYMLKYLPHVDLKKTEIIPHVVLDNANVPINKSESLRLIHSGTLLPPRDPKTLLRGLELFVMQNPNADFHFSVLGTMKDADFLVMQVIKDKVSCIPPVTYNESLAVLKDFDVTVIVEAACDEGIFLPTKVSDFMQSNRPIWAISPKEGLLHDLYLEGSIPYFSDVNDIESISKTMNRIYNDFMNGSLLNNNIPIEYKENYIVNKHKDFLTR